MGKYNTIKEHWPHIRGKLKLLNPELLNTDLTLEIGREEELITNLQNKTGKTGRQLIAEINTLVDETC